MTEVGSAVGLFALTNIDDLVILVITVYVVVFLLLVAVWCAAGRLLVSHRVVAQALARWGDHLLPVVLIAIGVLILLS